MTSEQHGTGRDSVFNKKHISLPASESMTINTKSAKTCGRKGVHDSSVKEVSVITKIGCGFSG